MAVVVVLVVVTVLLGGAVCIAVAGPGRRAALPSRFLVAALIGLVAGELLAVLALTGPIDDRLRDDADRAASSTPAVRAAQGDLDAAVAERSALDARVSEAVARRDQALTVARCEYRPGPACPQTSITGVPGQGAETRTANQRLAAAQTDLDRATAARAARTPEADARVARARDDVTAARDAATGVDQGIGARWAALNAVTGSSLSALTLRIGIDLVCVVLALLPLMLRLWRGDTVRDIRARQELESLRLASAAQLAIERRDQERRVELALAQDAPTRTMPAIGPSVAQDAAALAAAGFEPVHVTARRYVREAPPNPVGDDDYLPIAAAAEAASLAAAPRRPAADDTPTGPIPVVRGAAAAHRTEPEAVPDQEDTVPDQDNLPAPVAQSSPAVPEHDVGQRKPNPFVPPVLDDAARAVAGFVRPLVPPIVARVLPGPSTRTVQQSYEEVEEVTFSMRRTRKVTVGTTEQTVPAPVESRAEAARTTGDRGGAHAAADPLDVAHEEIAAARPPSLPSGTLSPRG
ncbi:DUF4407 domain-containing protein [Tsukamurella sp. 1534]|uniref:DUF4407 domain-containing protein n=1 Tax=Tsukamurella sp. 1534 TaxID=1151061 RepID=UPI0002E24B70|nr:DUF4407 domain-containing protein [Tsukamurella sp. 1534]